MLDKLIQSKYFNHVFFFNWGVHKFSLILITNIVLFILTYFCCVFILISFFFFWPHFSCRACHFKNNFYMLNEWIKQRVKFCDKEKIWNSNFIDEIISPKHFECHMYCHTGTFIFIFWYQWMLIMSKQKRKVSFKCIDWYLDTVECCYQIR